MVRFAMPYRMRTRMKGWSVVGTWATEDFEGIRRVRPGRESLVNRHYWAANTEGMSMADAVCHALTTWAEHGEPDALNVTRVWDYAAEGSDDPFDGLEGTMGGHDGYKP